MYLSQIHTYMFVKHTHTLIYIVFSKMMLGQFDVCLQIYELHPAPHVLCRYKLIMDNRPRFKTLNHKTCRRKE